VRAAIESMNGARFVHDQLELAGWQVAIADAQKVKGLAPLACKTDRIDAWVLPRAVPSRPGPRDLAAHPRGAGRTGTGPVPAAPGPPPDRAQEPHPRHLAGLRQALSGQRPVRRRRPSTAGPPGAARAVDRQRHRGLALIDDLDDQIDGCERELRRLGADHPYVPLLRTAPGIAWVLGYTIAAELGDITRFSSPKKLCGYTGLCPRVYQSGSRDQRGPLAKNGPPICAGR
jgi:transposase